MHTDKSQVEENYYKAAEEMKTIQAAEFYSKNGNSKRFVDRKKVNLKFSNSFKKQLANKNKSL